MIIALIHQCLIFIIIYYFYSDDSEQRDHHLSQMDTPNVTNEKRVVSEEFLSGMIINGRFKVGDFLGGGYTGFVRNGTDMETGKSIAMKFARDELFYSLEKEYKNYLYLGANDPEVIEHGIPHILHFGDFAGYKILIMTKTGLSLHHLQSKTRFGKFGIKTISKIAIQGIRIFRYIHSKGLLFHDVKPANMAIGDGPEYQERIFFYDFAFGEYYLDAMGEPKQRENVTDMDGTPSYFAIDVLRGQSHVRKDELFSFGICLLDMNNADLPWLEKIKGNSNIFEAMNIVLNEWEKHGIEAICNTSDNPELFWNYFNYIESIDSNEEPNYDQLIELFSRQLTDEELNNYNLGISDLDNDPDKIELEAQLMGKVIGGRFEIKNYLRNEFAVFVHNGIDLETNAEVNIKFGTEEHYFWIEREYKNFLRLGADDSNIIQYGIPHIMHFDSFKKYKVLVMTKTGPTLEDLWFDAKHKLEIDFVYQIAIKTIRTLKYIHSKGLVVCDIKPSTLAIREENTADIFFLSFVFGESYVNAFDSNMQRLNAKQIRGTPEYMSIDALNKFMPVPKDDLISLGIFLMQLNGAHIPWMNKATDQNDLFERIDIILGEWEKHPIEGICNGTDNPKLFEMYFEHVNGVNSHEKPKYDELLKLFTAERANTD